MLSLCLSVPHTSLFPSPVSWFMVEGAVTLLHCTERLLYHLHAGVFTQWQAEEFKAVVSLSKSSSCVSCPKSDVNQACVFVLD